MTTPESSTSKTPSTTVVSTASIAVTAALVWIIQTYILHGNLPGPVTVAIYGIVPAIVGGFFTRHALNQMPPKLDAAIAARWDKKFHAQQGTKVVPKRHMYVDMTPVPLPTMTDPNIPFTAENPAGKDDNPFVDTSKEESL